MNKPKTILEILVENVNISKSGFSGEYQVIGLFKAEREIEAEGYIHKSKVRINK